MGTVFKARQNHMNRIVALKVLKPSLSRDERFVARLRREGRIVGALNHPNIVTGYDLGEEAGYHFFVMEFVDGESLRDQLGEREVFDTAEVITVAIQVAQALDHAFQQGVIHRDVKPANILIDKSGVVKLTDMGLAKGATDLTLTRDGATVGTPQFISPEQARNPQEVDIRSDLYSLGATLFQMATGRAPFSGDTIGELITKVLNEPAPEAVSVNPEVSPGLNLIIRKLLAKDPALRYQEPADLLDDLDRVQNDERPDVDLSRIERSDRRGRTWSLRLYGAIAGLVVVTLLAVFWRPAAEIGPSALEVYEAGLEAELSKASSLKAKLVIQQRNRAQARNEAQQRILKDLDQRYLSTQLAELETNLTRFIRRYVDERETIVRPWLNEPANWNRQGAFFRLVVDEEMGREVGFRRGDLPFKVRTQVLEEIDALLRMVEAMSLRRDEGYRNAYADFLANDLPLKLGLPLARHDFEAARRALELEVDGFHGSEGRPVLMQLGQGLREELSTLREEAIVEHRLRIDGLEKRDAKALAAELRHGLSSLRAALDAEDLPIAVCQSGLMRLRRGLEDDFPSRTAFSRDVDPWVDVERDLDSFERELTQSLLEESVRQNRRDLEFAFRLLITVGDPDPVIDLLESFAPIAELSAKREALLALLASASEVRKRVLGKLYSNPRTHEINTQTADRDGVYLRVRHDGVKLVLERRRDGEPQSFARLRLSQLLPIADKGLRKQLESDSELRRGLAMWLFLDTATRADALALVNNDPLFVQDLSRLVRDDLVVARPVTTEKRAQQTIALLNTARAQADYASAAEALREIDERYGETAAVKRSETSIRAARTWLRGEKVRLDVLSKMGSEVPKGVTVVAGSKRFVTLRYPLAELDNLRRHPSWRKKGESLQFTPTALTLDKARKRQLVLSTPLQAQGRLEADWGVQFRDLGQEPQLVALSVYGIGVAFMVLPDGTALATLADPEEYDKRVRRRISKKVSTGDPRTLAVLPGAIHRVRMTLNYAPSGSGGQVTVSVHLDRTLLCKEPTHLPVSAEPMVGFMPLQAIVLRDLVMSGTALR